MVHVREINGEPVLFGNQGALFKGAMTWWDHKTESIWSQVWGRAIEGPLKGTELTLLTSSTVPWRTWRAEHPDTLVMLNDLERFRLRKPAFHAFYVIGIELDGAAKAYPYRIAEQEQVINDQINRWPVLVFVDPDTHTVHTFLRMIDGHTLTFERQDKALVDHETGSTWDPVRGLAVEGPLRGSVLRPLPYVPAYERAWQRFYPQTEFYTGRGGTR